MSAVFSRCGLYRYQLERPIGQGAKAVFIGVNPSRADATRNDATIRKLIGFAPHLGVGHWLVGNVFAYAATDIAELRRTDDPVGARNHHYLTAMLAQADMIILGWGQLGKLPVHLRSDIHRIAALISRSALPTYCWGLTRDGQPRHPLMLAYATPLERWRPACNFDALRLKSGQTTREGL